MSLVSVIFTSDQQLSLALSMTCGSDHGCLEMASFPIRWHVLVLQNCIPHQLPHRLSPQASPPRTWFEPSTSCRTPLRGILPEEASLTTSSELPRPRLPYSQHSHPGPGPAHFLFFLSHRQQSFWEAGLCLTYP